LELLNYNYPPSFITFAYNTLLILKITLSQYVLYLRWV
jgi:hypothetical protein